MHLRLLLGVCWVWLPGPNRTAGVIVAAEPVAGKDKLSAIEVDIGDEEPVKIVTNAPNAKEGNRIVVATIGATVSPRPPPPPSSSSYPCSSYSGPACSACSDPLHAQPLLRRALLAAASACLTQQHSLP